MPQYLIRLSLLCFLTALLPACMQTQLRPSEWQVFENHGEPAGYYGETSLASGQIVVSASSGGMDMALSMMPAKFSPYIHLGILVIEDGIPYVYEELGSPSLDLDPEVPPTATIEGSVVRYPLAHFARRYFFVEIYEPANADREKVAEFARHHFAVQTPFDKFFDYSDDSAFYCAEFVARALEYGGSDKLVLTQNRSNRSISVLMKWLQVPETTLEVDSLIETGNPVMRLSRNSNTEILALIEIKRELHRRFTADQVIGNLFRWDLVKPELRLSGRMFVNRSMMRTETMHPDRQQIADVVRATADELFGPLEGL